MDKLSVKVLKKLRYSENTVAKKEIVDTFGKSATKSLSYLESEGYIKSGRVPTGINLNLQPVWGSDGKFSITSKGLSFLEERPGKVYDKWSTRFFAIWGAITGTTAIVLEIVLHFL